MKKSRTSRRELARQPDVGGGDLRRRIRCRIVRHEEAEREGCDTDSRGSQGEDRCVVAEGVSPELRNSYAHRRGAGRAGRSPAAVNLSGAISSALVPALAGEVNHVALTTRSSGSGVVDGEGPSGPWWKKFSCRGPRVAVQPVREAKSLLTAAADAFSVSPRPDADADAAGVPDRPGDDLGVVGGEGTAAAVPRHLVSEYWSRISSLIRWLGLK